MTPETAPFPSLTISAPQPKRLALTFLIGAVFVLAILVQQLVPLNPDVSWLFTVGERILDGQRLYRDIVEINPPMAAFAYLPDVALARKLGIDARIVMEVQLLLLAAASLLATARILLLSPAISRTINASLMVWAAAVLTILPMHVFGQREHIATLTFLPALAVYALRSAGEPLPRWAVLIAGLGAGITLSFKPYFAVPSALCIMTSAILSRSWRVMFSPENIIAAALVSVVSLGTYLLYPEYFTNTYPLVRDIYLSWSLPASTLFLNSATLIFTVGMLCVLLTRREKRDSLWLSALVASFGFAIAFFLQRRGWPYHSYPMVAFVMLAMGYALSGVRDPEARPYRGGIAAAFVLGVSFLIGAQWFDTRVYVGPIQEAVAGLKSRPRILVLSGEAAIGNPLVHDIDGIWVSRQESLWIREFVRLTREKTSVEAPTEASLDGYLALERKWLVEDFRKLPPDIILVDNLRDNWGQWARADAELAELLKPYVLLRSVEGIDILQRTK
jgi:hypothetical protein